MGIPVDDGSVCHLQSDESQQHENLRSSGQAEIEAQEVGMAILAPLRELDEVAYLRYASVYRNFTSLEDFEGEIALLRALPSSHSPAASKETGSSNSPITEKNSTAMPQSNKSNSNKTLANQNN